MPVGSAGLTPLGMLLAALQIFFWPIIILIYKLSPAWTPWAMASLFGAHFLPYAWLHRSAAYAFLSASVAASLVALALVTRGLAVTLLPALALPPDANTVAVPVERTIYAVTRTADASRPSTQALLDALESGMKDS